MKLFITTTLVAASLYTINCAQLNNNYLPPVGASQSGGGPGLQAPLGNNALGGISPPFAGANVPIAPGRQPSPAQPNIPSGPPIEILSYENVNNGDGSFKWSFESGNGIKAEEMGDVKNKGSDNAIQTVQGSYSYTSPEGQVVQISYTANENGFQAIGDAIPTPVPLPEENLRAIAEHEAALATAIPDTSGSGGPGPGGPGPGGPVQVGPGSAAPGFKPNPSGPGVKPGPQGPPSFAAPPGPSGFGGSPVPQGPAPSFSNQPRPGSGSYSPQSGYKY